MTKDWKLRKTRSMVGCAECGCSITWNKMNGAKFDTYYQKGKTGKRLCPDCFEKKEIE